MHEAGYLPVSVEYRFCPELNVIEGPMADVADALEWVRTQLPLLQFSKWPGLSADGAEVIVVGWSTGGTLAMSTAFTSLERKKKPPKAILAFFCPTDYEDDCKTNLNVRSVMKKTDGVFRVEESYLSVRSCFITKRALRSPRGCSGRACDIINCPSSLIDWILTRMYRSPPGILRRTRESLVCSFPSKTHAGSSFSI